MNRIETIGDATLYLGDCREILSTLPNVDVVVTDPPYGTRRYDTDVDEAVIPVARLYAGRVPLVMFGYPEKLCEVAIAINIAPLEWICWWPTNTVGAARSLLLPKESEHIAVWADLFDGSCIKRPRAQHSFGIKTAIQTGRDPDFAREGDVWRDPAPALRDHARKRNHINEKPVSVMRKLIGCCSGHTVLDPFMGSGTTGVAAVKLGRRFIGIEIEPKYFDIACRRIDEARQQPDLFVEKAKAAEQLDAFALTGEETK